MHCYVGMSFSIELFLLDFCGKLLTPFPSTDYLPRLGGVCLCHLLVQGMWSNMDESGSWNWENVARLGGPENWYQDRAQLLEPGQQLSPYKWE